MNGIGDLMELDVSAWANSAPIELVDLRGKVVLIEFWTYG